MTRRGYGALLKMPNVRIFRNVRLSAHTTFRIGGRADLFVVPKSVKELNDILLLARKKRIKKIVLGNASNVLFSDKGFRGVVIKLANGLNDVKIEDNKVTCGAGVMLSRLIKKLSSRGLSGLEFAFGVPATVGGAAVMNLGAYGRQIGDAIERVWAINSRCANVMLKKPGLKFRYRGSNLWDKGYIVTQVELKLKKKKGGSIRKVLREFLERRRAAQPLSIPNAGCIFRNPPGLSAGGLIEGAGMSGSRVGDAQVSTKHANFIVNLGGATSHDVLTLMEKIKKAVRSTSGIRLVPEIRIVKP